MRNYFWHNCRRTAVRKRYWKRCCQFMKPPSLSLWKFFWVVFIIYDMHLLICNWFNSNILPKLFSKLFYLTIQRVNWPRLFSLNLIAIWSSRPHPCSLQRFISHRIINLLATIVKLIFVQPFLILTLALPVGSFLFKLWGGRVSSFSERFVW